MGGYHFQRVHSKKNNIIKKEFYATAKETEMFSELICSASPNFEPKITLISNMSEGNTEVSVEKKESNNRLQYIAPKKTPNQVSCTKKPDKVNKASVNYFSLISILLIPVFFVSLFISSSVASLIVLGCLITGPILAILGATVTNKKQRNWMVGLSLGFWLLFVLYASLVLFVF